MVPDWKKLLDDLAAIGVSQRWAADLLDSQQGTLSSLYRGISKQPTYPLGVRLVALHKRHCIDGVPLPPRRTVLEPTAAQLEAADSAPAPLDDLEVVAGAALLAGERRDEADLHIHPRRRDDDGGYDPHDPALAAFG
jgi:hypothetical protein